MNEQIQKLIKQCTTYYNGGLGTEIEVFDKEKFAELIVKKCAGIAADCQAENMNWDIAEIIKEHFGVE